MVRGLGLLFAGMGMPIQWGSEGLFVRSGFKYWLCAESAYQKTVRNWPCKTVKYPSALRAMFNGMSVCGCGWGGLWLGNAFIASAKKLDVRNSRLQY